MIKHLLSVLLFVVCFISNAQLSPSESDSLKSRAVLVLPKVTISQLNNIKTEFAKYPQIQKAVFIYNNHNCLLIDFDNGVNPNFKLYSELIKMICGYVMRNEIFIKDSNAYNEIYKRGFDDSSFVLK